MQCRHFVFSVKLQCFICGKGPNDPNDSSFSVKQLSSNGHVHHKKCVESCEIIDIKCRLCVKPLKYDGLTFEFYGGCLETNQPSAPSPQPVQQTQPSAPQPSAPSSQPIQQTKPSAPPSQQTKPSAPSSQLIKPSAPPSQPVQQTKPGAPLLQPVQQTTPGAPHQSASPPQPIKQTQPSTLLSQQTQPIISPQPIITAWRCIAHEDTCN